VYIPNSRVTTKKKFLQKGKKSLIDMLREERKCNHIKFSINTRKKILKWETLPPKRNKN